MEEKGAVHGFLGMPQRGGSVGEGWKRCKGYGLASIVEIYFTFSHNLYSVVHRLH
jgi:hypothetical protein